MGIWNKAVGTFKNTAAQLVKEEKTREVQQPKQSQPEPEDDIRYDPVLKRYLINGKVPDDE